MVFFGLGMIFYFIFDDLPSFADRKQFGTVKDFSIFVGITLFAMQGIGMVINFF